jgi:ABC-type branched-subunit amino acid transport system ATPase component
MNRLEVSALSRSFGGLKVVSGFSCTVGENEIVGVIGPNGSGKTTFFNLVTGFLPADAGSVLLEGKNLIGLPAWRIANLGVSRTFQIIRLIRRRSVLENVMLAFKAQPGEDLFDVFFRSGKCKDRERQNQEKALGLLDYVGLSEKAKDPADALSYGQQKLLSLAACLASDADLLLLDEPVAGVAPEMLEKIISVIRDLPGKGKSVILIEHNIDMVMQVCHRVIFMDAGVKVCEGPPEQVRNAPKVLEACLGR